MANQGPTLTAYDASTFAGFASWANSGIKTALTAFGWAQTSDGNQINWATATSPPFSSTLYPNTVAATSVTAGGPVSPYTVNSRGTWVSGTTYTYLDMVYSDPAGGGTGNTYLLSRQPLFITSVSVTAGTATITCSHNLAVGEQVKITTIVNAAFLRNQTVTVISAPVGSFTCTAPNGIQTYVATSESIAGTAVIILTSTTRPETDTKNYIVYHYEIWKTTDTSIFTITNVSRSAGGLATFTCTNRLKPGFVVSVAGLTNVPTLNGTWTVFSATSSQFTVQTGGGLVNSTSDSGTATYSLWPICMKFEYWGNTVTNAVPWIRVSFGTATDGIGNVAGNRISTDTTALSSLGQGCFFPPLELRTQNSSSQQTTSLTWRNIWSGSTGDFGAAMWYMNNSNVPGANGIFLIVERGRDVVGNTIDDYFTHLAGANGASGPAQFSGTNNTTSRSIFKPNPIANITSVAVDNSNNVTVNYTTTGTLTPGYQFTVGAIVYLTGLTNATFLNNRLAIVTAATSNSFTFAFTHAIYGPLPETGNARLSISLAAFTPISGTGGVCLADSRIPTPYTSLGSLTVNGNTPLLPVFPVPGFVGNPMTMGMSVKFGDTTTHDTTTTVTLYGATHTYYFPTGSSNTAPWGNFGNANDSPGTNNLALRWD